MNGETRWLERTSRTRRFKVGWGKPRSTGDAERRAVGWQGASRLSNHSDFNAALVRAALSKTSLFESLHYAGSRGAWQSVFNALRLI